MRLVDNKIDDLKLLCTTYHVDKMYLFGSALDANFNSNSDIDFLVKFQSMELFKYFDNYLALKERLEKLFERKVDLVEEQTLKNPVLIKSINKSKKLIYG